jgi:hypothetical protein
MNWLRFIKEIITGRCCFKSRCDKCLRKDRIDERLGWIAVMRPPVSPNVIEWVRVVMYAMINEGSVQVPYLFPTEDGGINVEWCDMEAWPSVNFDNYFKPLRVYYIKDNDSVEIVLAGHPALQAHDLVGVLNRLSKISRKFSNNDISS